jgi:hypothetical protein
LHEKKLFFCCGTANQEGFGKGAYKLDSFKKPSWFLVSPVAKLIMNGNTNSGLFFVYCKEVRYR